MCTAVHQGNVATVLPVHFTGKSQVAEHVLATDIFLELRRSAEPGGATAVATVGDIPIHYEHVLLDLINRKRDAVSSYAGVDSQRVRYRAILEGLQPAVGIEIPTRRDPEIRPLVSRIGQQLRVL